MKTVILKILKFIFKVIIKLLKIIFIMPLMINSFRIDYDIDKLDKDFKSL